MTTELIEFLAGMALLVAGFVAVVLVALASGRVAQAPRCPFCGAEYFDCTTDGRGICVEAPAVA